MRKILLSLFDHSGNSARPFKEMGWEVIQVDIKNGIDIMTWNYAAVLRDGWDAYSAPIFGIIAMIPCTDYALCGAKWFAKKDTDGRTEQSQKLTEKTKEIINFFDGERLLKFWVIENPASRIHKLNPWLGSPRLKYHPHWYAGYDPIPVNSQYKKLTWFWGRFNIPEKKELPSLLEGMKRHSQWGGKSEKTKENRSLSPMGPAYAFAKANG